MLTHLSATSPYVCDLNRGPIEPANRMASTIQSKKVSILLEHRESLPKPTRTPLKLLAPDEVPLDSTAFTHDVDASLQPVWYTEQTIVDEQAKMVNEEEVSIAAIIHEQQRNPSIKPASLSPIESQYSSVMEDNELPSQPSLMHKSSTFTIEPESCTSTDSQMNDSEKENSMDRNPINQPTEDSFRALEHLLGLGSAATTVRESPKTNHDTLSLTVVTPTDIVNAMNISSRTSFLPKSEEESLPSPQTLAPMPTIESMDSTMPPSFLAENTVMEDDQQQTSSIKDDSNTDDDTNFSFELNDFGNNSKDETSTSEPMPVPTAVSVPEPAMNIRAPTCADVAFRALVKPRSGGRVSQPVKVQSPLAKSNKNRSSAPITRLLRSSCRRVSTELTGNKSTVDAESMNNTDCLINESQQTNRLLVQMITLPEEDEDDRIDQTNSVTLNLTDVNESDSQNSVVSVESEAPTTPTKPVMPLLSREYTYNSPKPRSSQRRRSMLNQIQSTAVEQTTMMDIGESASPSISSRSMLGVLLTTNSASSSSLIVLPRQTSRRSRQSARVSSQSAEKNNMDPLHSSTPSSKRYSVQMVSIGEEEQVSITVPPPISMDQDETKEEAAEEEEVQIEMVPLNDTIPVSTVRTMEIGIQTTPSLDSGSRRQLATMEQQTTPQVQTKTIVQLQRNVRFQLTPTTDARLAEKEKQEEQLRGLKPDIVPLPVTNPLADQSQKVSVSKKAAPRKKSARRRSQSPKAKMVQTRPSSKTRKVKVAVPDEPSPTIKRMPRKRANTKSVESIVQPAEPVAKRAKVSKVTVSAHSPSSGGPRTRSRSTTKSTEPSTSIEEKKIPTEIATMTVAALKTRLNTHQSAIPKGAKKSDLVALLLSIENKTNKKLKKAEITETVSSIATRTRRQKK